MKKLIFSGVAIFSVVAFNACKKSETLASVDPVPQSAVTNIYLAGSELNAAGTFDIAKYWKNGVATSLTDGTKEAGVTSIFVSGNDIYVLVEETTQPQGPNTATVAVAKYFKNGVPTTLQASNPRVSKLVVLANDVYVSGYEYPLSGANTPRVPKYWKNGIPITLPNGNSNIVGYVSSMCISGNDIYVCGTGYNLAGVGIVKYWKNGVPFDLPNGTKTTYARDIFVSGTDVYVVGDEHDNSVSIYNSKVKYWKNGISTDVTDGNLRAFASTIFVTGTDVYVGYNEDNLGNTTQAPIIGSCKYWKNGVVTNIQTGGITTVVGNSTSSSTPYLSGLFVLNGDLYSCGYSPNSSTNINDYNSYWKNTTGYKLTGNGINIGSIFITNQ
jgi:hypothetical protein